MNYQHLYHAGNFADVMKHLVLLHLLAALTRKPTPFCYVETHAGLGYYDLNTIASAKLEYSSGIAKLLSKSCSLPLVSEYLTLVKNLKANTTHASRLNAYPGSPYLASQLLRPQDRLILCELNPYLVPTLKQLFNKDQRVAVHHLDGYQGLKAFLPPREKRGLILIDPPFEQADEFKQIFNGLKLALAKFAQGVYAIWYPIKDQHHLQKFKRQLQGLTVNNLLAVEFAIDEINPMLALSGCGMLIVNAPWQVDTQLKELMAWLWPLLAKPQRGFYQVDWLISPR